MCGIAGIWNRNGEPVDQVVLRRFTDSLSHRGPDGNGFYVDSVANLGLGHRRLAILDTSEGGRQPMAFADGRYWITYNGEIYNFLELKSELEGYGYQFRTNSDTEVILTAYQHWGEECQLRFNGMWAFAIWDREERKLFLSRDRFGVKPLIHYYDDKRFAFASEMKAFLELDWFRLDFSPSMITTALSNARMTEGNEACLLQGLKHLLGGHCLTIKPGEQPTPRRWWRTLDHFEKVPKRYEDQVLHFRELFLDACRIRMRSDVPIGTALSGGLDSSSVVCGMRHIRNTNKASDRLANDWQKALVVTLDGHGGDETLAGYTWYITAALKDAIQSVSPLQVNELLMILKGLGAFSDGHILKTLKNYSTKRINRRNHSWLLQRPVRFEPSNYIADLPMIQSENTLFKSLYVDFHFTQLPTVLRNFDRISMAHGVEIRSPFLDWRLVSYLFSLPTNTKIGSGFTKRILRDALRDILPDSIRTRTRKLGFHNLAEAWTSRRAQEFMRDVATSLEFQQSSIWNGKRIVKDLEIAARNQDTEQLHRVWIFVQAMSLIRLFREKRNNVV